MAGGFDAVAGVRELIERADERVKAASNRADPTVAHDDARALLTQAELLSGGIVDLAERDRLCIQIVRRLDDLGMLERRQAGGGRPIAEGDDTSALPQPGPETLAVVDRAGPDRLPPNQRLVTSWPVLHVGRVPAWSLDDVVLRCRGLVAGRRRDLTMADLRALPEVEVTTDVHCVTGWSRFDNTWTGVRIRDVFDLLEVDPSATHCVTYGANAYSANLDVATMVRDDGLLAWAHDGEPLAPEHGGPLRTVVPSRYLWKSVKWVEGFQLLDRDVPGYWEVRGYHNVADPFLEQRYA